MTEQTVVFVAGDPSGDQHAAQVIAALKRVHPRLQCTGIGGPAMVAAGFTSLMPFEPFNRMGYLEVLLHLPFFLRAKRFITSYIGRIRPCCVVCVDYSGFNVPLMKAVHSRGIPVIWYIPPMVWAWKKKRARILARFASQICCIFPFEVDYFTPYTEKVQFVGNPVVEGTAVPGKREPAPDVPVLAIVPGSRVQEVSKNLPPMLGAFRQLKKRNPEIRAVVSHYHGLPDDCFRDVAAEPDVELFSGTLTELYNKANVALVTSGTATLEAALAGLPHVIVYKTSPLTYAIFSRFVAITHIGLPNIIAGEGIVPECIQEQVEETVLCGKIELFLEDRAYYQKTVDRLLRVRNILGAERPSIAVAKLIEPYL